MRLSIQRKYQRAARNHFAEIAPQQRCPTIIKLDVEFAGEPV
jgi:hypothetical protein